MANPRVPFVGIEYHDIADGHSGSAVAGDEFGFIG
jgi:hypothetical protein